MKVIIAGGGIGGLVTALMLHARGIDCEIFEQADAIRELGVGINTLPHAIKELADLGLLERLDAVAIRTYELFYTNRFGQEIWREPRGARCRLRHSAILHPSRPASGRDLSGGARAARRIAHPHELPARLVHGGRQRRHRLFLRSQRRASAHRARRRADRRRRHPFGGARQAVSERRAAALERPHAVARRHRLAGVFDRTLDGRRRRACRQARDLSDRRGIAARQDG